MKKVCCFVEHWESGGIESFLYNILTRIDLTNFKVDIVAASLGHSIFTEPLKKIGIRFFELSGSQRKVSENYKLFRLLLREQRWDVLHLNAFQGLSLRYLRLAKEEGVPVRIAHSHNTSLRKSLSRPLKLLIHRLAKKRYTAYATSLWACSGDAADFLFDTQILRQNGYTFVPNGIDTERFRFDPAIRETVRTKLGFTGKYVIGNVGRLCYHKNQEFLLDVFSAVSKQRPESLLLLAGEGEDRPRLEQKAKELDIADKVVFYGLSDQIEQLFWAMDVFVFPSRFEGLGIVAIEAQAAGLNVICSEYVPKEVYVTPLAQKQFFADGAALWARRIIGFSESDVYEKRSLAADAVKEAGFDIKDTAKNIMKKYSVD